MRTSLAQLIEKATSERAPWGTIPYRCEHDDVKFRKDIGKAYPKTEVFYKLNMSVDELNCRRKISKKLQRNTIRKFCKR